jgi:hypothetical protein
LLRGELQIGLEHFGDSVFLLSVHSSCGEPLDVEPGFYEVRILGESIKDSGGALAGNFLGHLIRVTINGGCTRRTQSLRLGARWSHSGGLGWLRTMRHIGCTQAGSRPGCKIWSRRWAGGALASAQTQGLRRLGSCLGSIRSQGLVSFGGLATRLRVFSRSNYFNILGGGGLYN